MVEENFPYSYYIGIVLLLTHNLGTAVELYKTFPRDFRTGPTRATGRNPGLFDRIKCSVKQVLLNQTLTMGVVIFYAVLVRIREKRTWSSNSMKVIYGSK